MQRSLIKDFLVLQSVSLPNSYLKKILRILLLDHMNG